MGYSNVQGALNVFTSTSTDSLVVRGDTSHVGNITAVSGYATFGNVAIANLFVTGNFTVTATNTQTTNAITINNAGTSTALKVIQNEGGGPGHIYNVAEFYDFNTLAMVIDPEGNVAIHTSPSPGYALTVAQGAYVDYLTAGTISGDGGFVTNVQTTSLTGTLSAVQLQSVQSNITSVGTVATTFTVNGLLIASNGSGLSNLNSSNLVGNVANANVALVVSQPAQPNITSLGTLTGLYSTGNIQASFFAGGGNALTNIQSSVLVGNVANANVALVVSQPAQPNITSLGTLTGLYSTGNIQASFFAGGGNALTNIQSSVLVGNVASSNVALVVSQPAQPNITSVGNGGTTFTVNGLLVASNASGISNLNASNLVGNVANANVALVVSQPAQPNITSVGKVGALFTINGLLIASNGSGISNINSSNLVGNVANANVALVVSQPAQPNITSVGTASSLFTVNGLLIAGNASGISNINSSNLVGNVANANVALVVSQPAQPNITSLGTLTGLYSSGNIAATFFAGGGNALTNIQSSVLVGNVANANVALVVSQPAQPNITSVGTLTGLYSTGNIQASFFAGGGNALTNIQSSVLVGNVANANVALVVSQPAQPNITSLGTLTSLNVAGNSNVTGTFYTTNIVSVGFNSNLTDASFNFDTITIPFIYSSAVSVNGTLVATSIIGQGNGVANVMGSNIYGNVANSNVAMVVSQPAQPNITSLGTLTGLYSTGNITATFFAGGGNLISNLNSSNLVGNVANANVALVVSQPAQPNITSVGNGGTTFTVNGLLIASNGSGLSNLNASNLVGNVANANVALVVSQPAQPNITSVGTVSSLFTVNGLLVASNGSGLSNLNASNLVGNVANANVAMVVSQPAQPNITSVGKVGSLFTVNGLLVASNASGISNINSSNLVGNVASSNVALVVSQPSQPNITSVGTVSSLFTVNGLLVASNASGISNINSSNLVGNVANANVALVVSQPAQPNITSVGTLGSLVVSGNANVATLNAASISTPVQVPTSSGIFMNLYGTYTLTSAGSWTGNIAGSITSNLFTLFSTSTIPLQDWRVVGSNPNITGPTANGGFRFNQVGPYMFTIVLCADNNIKTIALSSNTSDVHSNLADPGVWLYCYRISVGQDPSVPVTIPFSVTDTSRYYYIDFEAMNRTDNIHKTAYTNVTYEGYTGSYAIVRPI